MLEVGWSELLVIAIILIVVVGPKDLPAMMRTFGRVMGRVRTMANEFRSQFDEAMREAELDDVRKGLNEVNKYNPTNTIRDAMNPIRQLGQDIKSDLQKASTIPTATKADEGTPVAELSSDPTVDPEPVEQVSPETARAEPSTAAASKPQPAAVVQPAAVTPAAVVAGPVAAAKPKPARARKTSETAGDYPPPEKKVVKRKAAEPHVEHNVHVVAEAAKPAAKTVRKAPAKAELTKTEPTPKAKPAPKKKTSKTSDA